MGSKLVAFRCPVALMRRLDTVAAALGTTRSAVVIEAVRLLSREVRARGGRLVPPYSGSSELQRGTSVDHRADGPAQSSIHHTS